MAALTRISGDGQVAQRYGLEEAIFLDAMVFWYRTNRGDNRNFRDGRWWSHNSMRAYEQVFPWWTSKQVRRIIESCKAKGALLSGNYNQDRRDRTYWYSPGDEVLALYGEDVPGKCNCPNGQMQEPKRADTFAQMGEPLPCNTHVVTDMIPPLPPTGGDAPDLSQPEPEPEAKPKSRSPKTEPQYRPDWFERFWALYPRRTNRVAAVRAWDKLRPDLDLCLVMTEALKAQMESPRWREGPEYIPHPSTWLNGARWLDEVAAAPPGASGSGGWAPDPEVY